MTLCLGSHGALSWAPGETPWNPSGSQINLCGKIRGQGECVKCSICHNNGLRLHQTPFVERLPLPANCLKERDIERECLSRYDENMTATRTEIARCDSVHQLYNDSVASKESGERDVDDMAAIRSNINASLQRKQHDVTRREEEMLSASSSEADARNKMLHACADFNRTAGPFSFMVKLSSGAISARVLEESRFDCAKPVHPRQPQSPRPPSKPSELRVVTSPGHIPSQCLGHIPGLRLARVLRKVTLGGSGSLAGLQFIERTDIQFQVSGQETYWTEGGKHFIYKCEKNKQWQVVDGHYWNTIKFKNECISAAQYPPHTDILNPHDFRYVSIDGKWKSGSSLRVERAGTAGALLNTVTIGGLPPQLSDLGDSLYVERRELEFQVNGRETYWNVEGWVIYFCTQFSGWVIGSFPGNSPASCRGFAHTANGVEILAVYGGAFAQLSEGAVNGRFEKIVGAGVVALGSVEQTVFTNKIYAAPGSAGYQGTADFNETTLSKCQGRCASVPKCKYVTYWSDGACYLQEEGAVLWEFALTGKSSSVFPTAAAIRFPETKTTTTPVASGPKIKVKYNYLTACYDWQDKVDLYNGYVNDEYRRYETEMAWYKQALARYENESVPAYHQALERFEKEKMVFGGEVEPAFKACSTCSVARSDLSEKTDSHLQSALAVDKERQDLLGLHGQLEKATRNLILSLRHQKAWEQTWLDAEAKWSSQKVACHETEQTYAAYRDPFMASCIPSYYPRSCERACVDAQVGNGCGVMEGASSGSGTRASSDKYLTGLTADCAPPQPSWVMAPVTYDASAQDIQQCARITASQKPQYAQRILKTGWLMKEGRSQSFDRRFFIFESGDQVKSARLRYFDSSEAVELPTGESNPEKDIILWHAKGVKKKDYPNVAPSGACFKLYLDTRDYRFCVVASSSQQDRDEWVELIQSALRRD